ncbi:MAG: hypothetical protein KDC49_22205 [Saprospiraceae bacterium]|nr:hypothetical protein [Saprospiraceae bacterium]
MFSKAVFDQKLIHFLADLQKKKYTTQDLYGDALQNFRKNWDREAKDWSAMIDQALTSKISNRLWRGVDYFPKEMMMHFASRYPHLVREVFDDLFDEQKDITGRVGRFEFHCDQLLGMLTEDEPTITWRSHYHNAFVASIYLTFMYPERYTFFAPEMFCEAMALLGARKEIKDIPVENYFTIMRTMNKLIHDQAPQSSKLTPPFAALEFLYWLTETQAI